MTAVDLPSLTLAQGARRVRQKEVSPVELVQGYLQRIERLNGVLNAYITVLAEEALEQARTLEQEALRGEWRGPLHGVPVALKDLFATRGIRTTAGSRILKDWVPDHDATVVERLSQAGSILLGKLNMHEFAFGGTNVNPHFGPTRNPWDPERTSGGSSGGSAAAVAASLCAGSLGTDTAGSIRIPASYCGLVGLKPTYGRVSRYGVVPLAWSLDHVGPIARTVEDAALLLQIIAGYDPRDPASAHVPVPSYTEALKREVKGLKLGVPRQYFFQELAQEVGEAVEKAIITLAEMGMTLHEVSLRHIEYTPSAQWAISHAEAAAYHDPFLKTRSQEYGPDVRTRLQLGKTILATDYLAGQRVRRLLMADLEEAFRQVDVLVTPTMVSVAPTIAQCESDTLVVNGQRRELRPLMLRCTSPFNLTGLPAVTVPCGFSPEGLPIGLQIVGPAFQEEKVLQVAYAYEQSTEWHRRRPPLP